MNRIQKQTAAVLLTFMLVTRALGAGVQPQTLTPMKEETLQHPR